jgi:N-methylhydantoinase A/acetone carboxylase beta subunit
MSSRDFIMAIDAGGTMTDTFFVDRKGDFVVGKAQTTPQDESVGFADSAADALKYWDTRPEAVFPEVMTGIYSGTSMLNRLLERKGQKIGLIVTAGMEDYLRLERAIQTYLGYSYRDRLKVITHRHNRPLVPRERIFGVRGRIDLFGDEVIPLYEDEAAEAVKKLMEQEVDGIVVNLMFSYVNPGHEARVKEIAREIMGGNGDGIPLFLSSELYPVMEDFARLNTVLVEAYAAEPSRGQFAKISERSGELGAGFDLRVMASHGGTISSNAQELARTLISGPIGGLVGARYLADKLGYRNVMCSDIGGTSFDLGLITDGEFTIRPKPDMARMVLKLPLIDIDSVGTGTGSYIRLNPVSKRIEIGPDSAGARIGVCYPDGDVDTPTLSDCNVALGYLNPLNFLGGDVILDRDRAIRAIEEQIADPLNLDVFEAAEGVLELFEDHLRNEVYARIFGKGYSPEDYRLISYGGGGPLHVAGYTSGLNFEDVLIPAWAAGFSAFGCACADFEYRNDRTLNVPIGSPEIAPDHFEASFEMFAGAINAAWRSLEGGVLAEFAKSGIEPDKVSFGYYLRVQYVGQLNDVEIKLPFSQVTSHEDAKMIIRLFEEAYAKIYSLSASSPELGYLATTAVLKGVVDVEKPRLPDVPLSSSAPPKEAEKGTRRVYRHGRWSEARIYDMDKLLPGNVAAGVGIIESPSTTLVIPSGYEAYLDQRRIFHLKEVSR